MPCSSDGGRWGDEMEEKRNEKGPFFVAEFDRSSLCHRSLSTVALPTRVMGKKRLAAAQERGLQMFEKWANHQGKGKGDFYDVRLSSFFPGTFNVTQTRMLLFFGGRHCPKIPRLSHGARSDPPLSRILHLCPKLIVIYQGYQKRIARIAVAIGRK